MILADGMPLLAMQCPICKAADGQRTILARFNGTERGHMFCSKCGGTYDSDTAEIQSLFATGTVDATTITDREEYRKLFVETPDITGAKNTVYPKFNWDNNSEMQASLAGDIITAIRQFCTAKQPRVLDLGCGNGFTTRGMAREFGVDNLAGVDPSPTIVGLKSEPAIECHQGTLQQVAFAAQSFDAAAIIGNLMLHPDPSATMKEVGRVLKPGGIVVLDVKNIRSTTRAIARRLATLSRRLERSGLIQRNFVNMRFGLHRGHIDWLCPPDSFEILEVTTKPPRLLAFSNKSSYSKGLQGLVWSLADRIDRLRNEQSWLQVVARKRG